MIKPISFYGNSELNVLYFSDVHAKTTNIQKFKTAADQFDKQNKGKTNLKLACGDLNTATSLKTNMLVLKLMELIGLDASSVGNHELKAGTHWVDALNKIKPSFPFLSSNLKHLEPTEVEDKVAKSTIIKKNGEKVGLIGVSPVDYGELMLFDSTNNATRTLEFGETLKAVKEEVKKLEKQGINKIFLLSHTGKESTEGLQYYKKLAKLGGIDVIIGGHDHKEFDAWFTSDRGEPVKIVSVGKSPDKDIVGEDLDSFGILKATFDDYGILIPEKCKNKVEITSKYKTSQEVLDLEEEYLQTGKVISATKHDIQCKDRMIQENPLADLALDSMLWLINRETKGEPAEIALVNPGAARGSIKKGNITNGDIIQAFPYTFSTFIKAPLTKGQIVRALEVGAKSVYLPKISPGVMQVSGLKYTITPDKKIKDVCILNPDGSVKMNIDDAPDYVQFNVVYDKFLMDGVAGLYSLKKDPNDPEVEYFPYSLQDSLTEYLKENFNDKSVEIKTGRIKIEEAKAKDEMAATLDAMLFPLKQPILEN